MSIVAVGSLRGAPGATTLAVALAAVWDRAGRAPFLLEAEPDGGVLVARFGLGHHPSLTDLGVRARASLTTDDLWAATQRLPAGRGGDRVPVVVAHPSADQCHATLRLAAEPLARVLSDLDGHDVIIDAGRLRPGSPAAPLVAGADLTMVVVRPTLEDVDAAVHRLPALARAGLVVVGDRPYGPADVAAILGVELLGAVPVDGRAAGALTGAGRASGLGRLPLVRSVRALAATLADRLEGQRAEQPA